MTEDSDRIAEEAARYLAHQRGRISDVGDQQALSDWLNASVEHQRAFSKLERLWGELDHIKANPRMLAMREQARAAVERRRRMKLLVGNGFAVAAALLVMLVGPDLWRMADRPMEAVPQIASYSTRTGQIRTVTLIDGSQMTLDARSLVRVRYTRREREIDVRRGRAFFIVAKNPHLPFVVHAGSDSVTAVGTQFVVDVRPTSFSVALTEGRVRVHQVSEAANTTFEMNAGYELLIRGSATMRRIDPRQATGWVSGRLVFSDEPLSEIASEMQRYSAHRIVIDPSLAQKKMSAVLNATDPLGFLEYAQALGLGKAQLGPDGYRLAAR